MWHLKNNPKLKTVVEKSKKATLKLEFEIEKGFEMSVK